MRLVPVFLFLLLTLIQPPSSWAAQRAAPPRPHIIYILADDMGFYDAPWHNPLIQAPTLKKLAEDGVTLEQSYMMHVCSPSRAALLSGKYPHRSGMMYKSIKPLQPTGLPLNLTLLPETLRDLGYTTHAIGKWHLGFCKEEFTPLRRGFDSFRGFYTGALDYYSHSRSGKQESSENNTDIEEGEKKGSRNVGGFDFRNNSAPDDSKIGQYSTFEFVKNAKTILHNSDPQVPLFMYLALQNPHGPLEVPRQYLEKYQHETNSKRKVFMAMVSALDDAVQSVVNTLKKTGHYQNSIIVFSSDNGGASRKMGLNWPLRGSKGSLFEGGTRIPAFIAGPLVRQGGTAYQGIFHATDWFPTLVSAAGGTPPTDLDGIDQWGALKGVQSPPRKEMIYHIISKQGFQTAMRYENYKVLVGSLKDIGWFVPPEFNSIDKELLTNFLDSGRPMDVVSSRPHSSHGHDNSSVSDGLIYSDTSDMVTAENSANDYYYYDGVNDEDETNEDFFADDIASDDNVRLMVEILERNQAADEEQDSILDDGLVRFSEMNKHEKRALKRKRKQQKQEAKEQRKTMKHARKQLKQTHKKLRPMELESEGIQRFIGNKKRSIDSFDSVESILVSGIPIHLYDLKKDPYERHNIASLEPEALEDILHRLLPEMMNYAPPYNPPLTIRGQPSNFGGFWSSGWC